MKDRINIKPLSVNKCWMGRRFKTKDYKDYEKEVMILLKKQKVPEPPYRIFLEFGMSNITSDWDNPIKPFQDILQKRHNFNDRHVMEAEVKKVKVKKGEEYIYFELETLVD